MNSEDPFTSVNWDRDEASKDSPLNLESPILEEENAETAPASDVKSTFESQLPSLPAWPLDSSSPRLEAADAKPAVHDLNIAASGELAPETHSEANMDTQIESEFPQVLPTEKSGQLGEDNEHLRSDTLHRDTTPQAQDVDLNSRYRDSQLFSTTQNHIQSEPVMNLCQEYSQNGELEAKPNENKASQIVVETANEPGRLQPPLPSFSGQNTETPEISGERQMEHAFAKYKIDLHVTNPISDRDGNSKSYISYLVTSETNHPDILRLLAACPESRSPLPAPENVTVKVRRRYGDFRFLHDCLVSDFPQLLVPPLPPKLNFKYLTGDTFSTAFVHKRLNSLDRFVTFICQHKLLSQLAVFHYFVSDSSEWAAFTKNLKILKGEDGEGIVGKVVNEDLLTETIMNYFTPSKHKKETNKDILEISEKLRKLYENLVKLERIFAKLNKKHGDMRHDYELFLTQLTKLAALHESANHQDSSLDANVLLATGEAPPSNFKIFADALLYFLENWALLGRYIDESFLVSLKDCAKYIARLLGLIELHHNKHIDLQVLEEYLAKARADLIALGGLSCSDLQKRAPPNPLLIGPGSGGIVSNTTQLIKDTLSTSATPHIASSQTESKRQRLEQKIEHLEAEVVAQGQVVDSLTNRIIHEEYPNWDRFNKAQMKKSMASLCDQEIAFYRGLADSWTDVEARLVQRLEELE